MITVCVETVAVKGSDSIGMLNSEIGDFYRNRRTETKTKISDFCGISKGRKT